MDYIVLRQIAGALGSVDRDVERPLDHFQIETTRTIGGKYAGESRPFGIYPEFDPGWEDDRPGFVQVFGYEPAAELVVVAFCNDDASHRILAELCAYLAERFDGVIDFGGMLRLPIAANPGIDPGQVEWHQLEPHFRATVAGLPGWIRAVPYETASGGEWVKHVADAAFLRAWFEHPNFRMVK